MRKSETFDENRRKSTKIDDNRRKSTELIKLMKNQRKLTRIYENGETSLKLIKTIRNQMSNGLLIQSHSFTTVANKITWRNSPEHQF